MLVKLTGVRKLRLFTALCCLVYFTSYLTRLNYAAALTAIIADTGYARAAVSLGVTSSFFSYGLGQLISGCIGDRACPHLVILVGLAGSSLCNALLPLLPGVYLMAGLWCVNGFFQAMLWPPLVRIMAEYLEPADYRKCASAVAAAACLGTVAVYCAVPLAILLGGWQLAFFGAAVCGVLVLLVWYLSARAFGLHALAGGPAHWERQEAPPPVLTLWRESGLGLIALAIVLLGALRDGVTTWMPANLQDTYHLPPAGAIAITAVVSVFSIGGIYLASHLQEKLQNELKTACILFAAGLCALALLVPFVQSSVLVSTTLMTANIALMHGANNMLIGRAPAHFYKYHCVSTMSGLLNFFVYVGASVSTYGIALLSGHLGWTITVAVWALLALLGTLCCLARIKTWQRFTCSSK